MLSLLVFVVSGPIVGFSHDNLPFYLLNYQYPVTLGKLDTTGSWFCAHYRYAFLAHTILSLQNPTVCQPPNRHVCRQACRFLDQIFILSVIHKGLQPPCSFFTSGICSQDLVSSSGWSSLPCTILNPIVVSHLSFLQNICLNYHLILLLQSNFQFIIIDNVYLSS